MKRKNRSFLIADIERPHPTVADSVGDELGAEPLTVKLGDLWTDLVRGADDERDATSSDSRPSGSVPLIDKMKGILQWD